MLWLFYSQCQDLQKSKEEEMLTVYLKKNQIKGLLKYGGNLEVNINQLTHLEGRGFQLIIWQN